MKQVMQGEMNRQKRILSLVQEFVTKWTIDSVVVLEYGCFAITCIQW